MRRKYSGLVKRFCPFQLRHYDKPLIYLDIRMEGYKINLVIPHGERNFFMAITIVKNFVRSRELFPKQLSVKYVIREFSHRPKPGGVVALSRVLKKMQE